MAEKRAVERCIVCGLEKPGLKVREDFVIKGIRVFKRYVTRNEKGYALVVCKECYPKYKKERDRMVRRRLIYLIIGVLFAAIFIALSPNKALALLYGALIVLFLYLLSLVNYTPALDIQPKAGRAEGTGKGRNVRRGGKTTHE